MLFHKITWDEDHPFYTYHSASGTSITIRPGDKSPDGRTVTKEDIRILVSLHNAEVKNNIKNCKAPLSDREKAAVREWEESHPGEKAPAKWNASLDCIVDDHEEMDCTPIMYEIYNRTHAENPAIDRLWELIDQMTEVQRRAFIMFRLEHKPLKEIAAELGCCVSAVSRAVSRAEDFIRENF